MIAGVKLQSSSQAGPEVNRDLETLADRMNQVIREAADMRRILDGLTGGSSGTPGPPTGGNTGGGGGTASPGITTVSPALVDSDTATMAWATYTPTIPGSATHVILWCNAVVRVSGDDLVMRVRADSSADPRNVIVIDNVDSDGDSVNPSLEVLVPLSSGSFDLEVTGTLSAGASWQVYLHGYL